MATPILATFTDELTGEEINREICEMSEFFTATLERQAAALQHWADTRGNDQHNTLLTFVRWAPICLGVDADGLAEFQLGFTL